MGCFPVLCASSFFMDVLCPSPGPHLHSPALPPSLASFSITDCNWHTSSRRVGGWQRPCPPALSPGPPAALLPECFLKCFLTSLPAPADPSPPLSVWKPHSHCSTSCSEARLSGCSLPLHCGPMGQFTPFVSFCNSCSSFTFLDSCWFH